MKWILAGLLLVMGLFLTLSFIDSGLLNANEAVSNIQGPELSVADNNAYYKIQNKIKESGVKNPITAVLLNFRAYDTLLEIGVLVLALFAMLGLNAGEAALKVSNTSQIQKTQSAILVFFSILVGFYLTWVGSYSPGGAFPGGAAIAGALIAYSFIGDVRSFFNSRLGKLLTISGLAVFIAVAVLLMLQNGYLLQFITETASNYILIIELFLTVTIAMVLAGLFLFIAKSDISS